MAALSTSLDGDGAQDPLEAARRSYLFNESVFVGDGYAKPPNKHNAGLFVAMADPERVDLGQHYLGDEIGTSNILRHARKLDTDMREAEAKHGISDPEGDDEDLMDRSGDIEEEDDDRPADDENEANASPRRSKVFSRQEDEEEERGGSEQDEQAEERSRTVLSRRSARSRRSRRTVSESETEEEEEVSRGSRRSQRSRQSVQSRRSTASSKRNASQATTSVRPLQQRRQRPASVHEDSEDGGDSVVYSVASGYATQTGAARRRRFHDTASVYSARSMQSEELKRNRSLFDSYVKKSSIAAGRGSAPLGGGGGGASAVPVSTAEDPYGLNPRRITPPAPAPPVSGTNVVAAATATPKVRPPVDELAEVSAHQADEYRRAEARKKAQLLVELSTIRTLLGEDVVPQMTVRDSLEDIEATFYTFHMTQETSERVQSMRSYFYVLFVVIVFVNAPFGVLKLDNIMDRVDRAIEDKKNRPLMYKLSLRLFRSGSGMPLWVNTLVFVMGIVLGTHADNGGSMTMLYNVWRKMRGEAQDSERGEAQSESSESEQDDDDDDEDAAPRRRKKDSARRKQAKRKKKTRGSGNLLAGSGMSMGSIMTHLAKVVGEDNIQGIIDMVIGSGGTGSGERESSRKKKASSKSKRDKKRLEGGARSAVKTDIPIGDDIFA